MERLVSATDSVMFHQAQGGVKALRAIREVYEQAPAVINKISARTKEHA
jgi:hypothetical protein